MKERALPSFQQNLVKQCPKCNTQSLTLADAKDIVEELAEIAEQTNTEVEMISTETEEGQMLKNSFGGIAAILRFKPSH
jgi:peptide chain release factor subunit 1